MPLWKKSKLNSILKPNSVFGSMPLIHAAGEGYRRHATGLMGPKKYPSHRFRPPKLLPSLPPAALWLSRAENRPHFLFSEPELIIWCRAWRFKCSVPANTMQRCKSCLWTKPAGVAKPAAVNHPPQSSSQLCLSSLNELSQVKLLCVVMGAQVHPALPWPILHPCSVQSLWSFFPAIQKSTYSENGVRVYLWHL